jgi:hypothetical protein
MRTRKLFDATGEEIKLRRFCVLNHEYTIYDLGDLDIFKIMSRYGDNLLVLRHVKQGTEYIVDPSKVTQIKKDEAILNILSY